MISRVKGSSLTGAMVIAMAEGTKIGKVDDIFIDKEYKQLLGISYKPSGWGSGAEDFIAFGDILRFGRELAIISGQAAVKARPENIETSALKKLKGCKISTQSGRELASLDDVVLNREDGRILELLLPEHLKLEIDIGDVIFWPHLIMVPAGYEPGFAQVEADEDIQRRRALDMSGLTGKFQEGIANVKNSEHTEKVIQLWKSGSQKARGTYLKTSEAIQQALSKISKKRESEKEVYKAAEPAVPQADIELEPSEGPPAYHDETAQTPGQESETAEKI